MALQEVGRELQRVREAGMVQSTRSGKSFENKNCQPCVWEIVLVWCKDTQKKNSQRENENFVGNSENTSLVDSLLINRAWFNTHLLP